MPPAALRPHRAPLQRRGADGHHTDAGLGAANTWVGPAVAAALGTGAIGMVAVVDPNTTGAYPTCPSLALFGVLCPLCGGLRGVHALTDGDLVGMVSSNLLLPLVMVLGSWAWLSWALASVGHPVLRPPTLGRRARVVLLVVAVGYTVLRNLTGTPFDVLAP